MIRRTSHRAALLATSLTALGVSPAFAQSRDYSDTSRATTVRDTIEAQTVARREVDAEQDQGFRIGAFTVRPRINIDSSVTDNLFATATDRRTDFYTTIAPEITIQADQSHSAIAARVYYARDVHARYGSEDASSYGGSTDLRYNLGADTQLTINALADRAVESRSSLGSFRQLSRPARFTQFGGQASLRQAFGQAAISVSGRGYRLAYSDALLNGATISQKYRTFNIFDGVAQGEFSVNQITSLVVRGTAEFRRYDLRPGDPGFDPVSFTDRNADGVRIEAGAVREVSSLLYATLRVGYLHYDYADPRLRDVSSFSYYGNIRWNVTQLTTVTASAERRLDETTSPLTAGNLRDEFSVSVDHELLRSLVVGGLLRYAAINPAGVSANSDEFAARATARYHVGRNFLLSLSLDHAQRNSALAAIAYDENRLTFGVRYAR